MTNNTDLEKLLTNLKVTKFRGFFFKDELHELQQDSSYIINIQSEYDKDGNRNKGTNWVALVLDKKIKVILAVDSAGKNLTPSYDNHDIFLRKGTFYDGPLEVYANGTKYVGTWASNKDYSILDLNIEGVPEFEFYNTVWRFTLKSLDLLKIAPVQNPGQKQLHLKKDQ